MNKLLLIPAIFLLIFTSCEKEESLSVEKESYLKSYKISRDATGRYSIDYEVKDDVSVEAVKNLETNVNEFHLTSGKIAMETQYKQQLLIEDSALATKFYDNTDNVKGFIVEDDKIALAKGGVSEYHLDTYSIQDIGNDTYQVDFKVKDGISVSYVYNEEEDVYEIHLQEGAPKTLQHTVVYQKVSNVLKIDFVNYIYNASAKSSETTLTMVAKPKFVTL